MTNRQRGISMIETLGALAIGSLMLLGLTAMIDRSMAETKGQQAALYQAQIVGAAKKYINAKYAELKINPAVGAAARAISIDDLVTATYLPAGFSNTNPYRQNTCVLIRQPTADNFDALVVTSGGTPIEEKEIRLVAANAGSGGGYITKEDPSIAAGTTWKMATAAYQGPACAGSGGAALTGTDTDVGHLASRIFHDGQMFSDFLYRNQIPGRPNLNTMNTPLRMANNAVVIPGSACGTQAAIAIDAQRNLLRCDATNKWSTMGSWKESVVNHAALVLLNGNNGDVRMVRDIGKAFMYDSSSAKWIALAEDEFGNFPVKRDLLVGGNATVATNLQVQGMTEALGAVHADQDFSSGSDITTKGDLTAANHVKADANVNAKLDVLAARDVVASQDINAGRDVLASRDLSAKYELQSEWLRVKGSIDSGSLSFNYSKSHQVGQACNMGSIDRFGNVYYMWMMGTLVPEDGTGITLYCGQDQVFHYVNE